MLPPGRGVPVFLGASVRAGPCYITSRLASRPCTALHQRKACLGIGGLLRFFPCRCTAVPPGAETIQVGQPSKSVFFVRLVFIKVRLAALLILITDTIYVLSASFESFPSDYLMLMDPTCTVHRSIQRLWVVRFFSSRDRRPCHAFSRSPSFAVCKERCIGFEFRTKKFRIKRGFIQQKMEWMYR